MVDIFKKEKISLVNILNRNNCGGYSVSTYVDQSKLARWPGHLSCCARNSCACVAASDLQQPEPELSGPVHGPEVSKGQESASAWDIDLHAVGANGKLTQAAVIYKV